MNFKIIRYAISGCLLSLFFQVNAQDTYFAEIGVHGGTSYYLGDANNQLFKNPELAYGLIYRQKINQRFAASANWNYTKVTGNSEATGIFENPVHALDFCGEFNFFSYERKEYLPFSKTYSTFIFAGIGGVSGDSIGTISLPFGVGFKMMIGNRLNLNVMWTNRLMFSDNLEGDNEFNNPAELNGSNIFNNDMLSTLSIGITFNIWKKKCDCSNESF